MKFVGPMGLCPLILVGVFAMFGCRDRRSEEVSAPEQIVAKESERLPTEERGKDSSTRKIIATRAKDALMARLSGRLMEVMQSDGPAAAIEVCSQEAVTIAAAVGEEHGVEIGRTSFKLRNQANAPREWMKEFVEARSDSQQQIRLDDGNLGVLYPIHLRVQCLMCHGQPEELLDVVKPEIAKRFPHDEATGFKINDLRGWFWVEVPAD